MNDDDDDWPSDPVPSQWMPRRESPPPQQTMENVDLPPPLNRGPSPSQHELPPRQRTPVIEHGPQRQSPTPSSGRETGRNERQQSNQMGDLPDSGGAEDGRTGARQKGTFRIWPLHHHYNVYDIEVRFFELNQQS